MVHALRGPVPSGTVLGRWTVIAEAPRRSGIRHLLCRCECGTERAVCIASLRKGESGSCGCLIRERHTKHGMYESAEYMLWRAINQRCHNPKNSEYRNYGGRGISVCQQWRYSFEAFLADVGRKPDARLSLDSIDNDGHYEPGNVRWATRVEQMSNTRITHDERVRLGRINAMKRWHPESL